MDGSKNIKGFQRGSKGFNALQRGEKPPRRSTEAPLIDAKAYFSTHELDFWAGQAQSFGPVIKHRYVKKVLPSGCILFLIIPSEREHIRFGPEPSIRGHREFAERGELSTDHPEKNPMLD